MSFSEASSIIPVYPFADEYDLLFLRINKIEQAQP